MMQTSQLSNSWGAQRAQTWLARLNRSAIVLTLLILPQLALAATYYVDASRPDDSGIASSWATAKKTIQAAVDLTKTDDSVRITNGIYAIGSRLTPGYACLNRVVITNKITLASENGPAATIIQGQGSLGSNAVRCVYISAGILVGFTITNGNTLTTGAACDRAGGGVNMYGGNATVSNCTISGNAAMDGGGTAFGTVNNCTINGNSAESAGGGTYACILNNCTISGNSANSGGGAAYGILNNSMINNCEIIGNSAGRGGGSSACTLNNCTISANSAKNGGGGGSSACTLNNCTICANSASDYGGGTYGGNVRNSIIWYNTAPQYCNFYETSINNSCTIPLAPGIGNITKDPLLVSQSRINSGSPCIGAGSNSYTSGTDIDGEAWRSDPAMGCDEVYMNGLTGSLLVAIGAPSTAAVVGVEIDFTALIVGRPSSNHWRFGDAGAASNKAYIQHSWNAVGHFNVILSAFNTQYPAGIAATVGVSIVKLDQATFYANVANTAANYPYKSWATASTNIQDAVDNAQQINGARVLVTNGVYASGTRVTPGYACSNRLVITKKITVQSVTGPSATIINGKGPIGNSAVRCVYMSAGTIIGFTITNGCTQTSGEYSYDRNGGGVNMYGGNATVSNCTISGNQAGKGGGTYCGTVNNCTISFNAGGDGGGTCDSAVNNCTLKSNRADYGAGSCRGTVNNCTVIGNMAFYNGGGMRGSTVNNSMITSNSASWGAGTAGGAMNNCTIIGNFAADYGGGTALGTMTNCIIWSNMVSSILGNIYQCSAVYTCSDPLPAGAGNTCTNPLFVNAGSCNYRLQQISPCINMGTNLPEMLDDVDLDGNPRILQARVDMGAYEYAPSFWCSFNSALREMSIYDLFYFTSTVSSGTPQTMYYRWDFQNDGTIDVQGQGSNEVTYAYQLEGLYSVKLVVSNETGNIAINVKQDYITVTPEPAFIGHCVLLGIGILRDLVRKNG
jgi:hypothetical protein